MFEALEIAKMWFLRFFGWKKFSKNAILDQLNSNKKSDLSHFMHFKNDFSVNSNGQMHEMILHL